MQRIILLATMAGALHGAVPATVAEGALTGPEVAKLDWNTRALQAVDLDGDRLQDIVLVNNDKASIELLYQRKAGGKDAVGPARTVRANRWEPVLEDARFRRVTLTTGLSMFDLAAGDLNGDGRTDLAYTSDTQALTIRYQESAGEWRERIVTEAPPAIQFVAALRLGDLNGDGRTDLAMLGQRELAVFFQDAKGVLGTPERFALPDDNCYGLELCDADGDGRPDLVYLNSGHKDALRVRFQNAQHQFGPEQAFTIKPVRSTLQLLKPTAGRPRPAFAAALSVSGHIEVFQLGEDKGAGTALRPRMFSPRAGLKGSASYAVADFDGDGAADVAVSDPDAAQVHVYFRQSDGGFTGARRFPSMADLRSIVAVDWAGTGRAELVALSAKEQTVGVSTFGGDGRLSYPQPLVLVGKPLALAAGPLDDRTKTGHLFVLRDEKGKKVIEVLRRSGSGVVETVTTIDVAATKTDPKALRLVDFDQDGRTDVVMFTPLEAMRVYLQKPDGTFADASTGAGYRKGLVDNLDAALVSLGDVEGDGRPELLVSGAGFARALRMTSNGELQVVDQFNAKDPSAEIATALIFPNEKAARSVLLYDRKGDQFQVLRPDAQGVYQVSESITAGKIEVVGAELRGTAKAPEVFIFGKDRFWWLPLGGKTLVANSLSTYATDLPETVFSDVIAGDLTGDAQADLVAIDPDHNVIELLEAEADGGWRSVLHFKVFETDEHYEGRKGSPQEPRETIIADVTGDGLNDLILLVHDRVLIYPQEK